MNQKEIDLNKKIDSYGGIKFLLVILIILNLATCAQISNVNSRLGWLLDAGIVNAKSF